LSDFVRNTGLLLALAGFDEGSQAKLAFDFGKEVFGEVEAVKKV